MLNRLRYVVCVMLWLAAVLPAVSEPASWTREEAEGQVEKAYLDLLQRHPDPSGLKTHADLLLNGMPVEDLRASLKTSDEGRRVASRVKRRTRILLLPVVGLAVGLLVVVGRSRNAKECVFKIVLLGMSVGCTCLLAEVYLRAQASWRSQQAAEAWRNIEGAKKPNPNALVTLKDVIHLSANHDIVYELFPNLDVRFLGKAMRSDDNGFRVTPGSWESPDAFRIAGLGDSVMFGWGVADDETYLTHLCNRVHSTLGRPVSVWNTAVPGYNTTMEVETLEQKIIPRDPDLVLLHYVDNDLGLPNFIPQKDDSVQRTRSHLVAALSQWQGGRRRTATFERLVRRAGPPPEAYVHMVGEAACVKQIHRLAALAAEHGFRTAIICNWEAPDFLASAADDVGIPVIELGDMIRAYREDHNIKGFKGSILTVSKTDPHYSALAHELVADEVFRRLQAEGLLSP